MPAGQSFSRHVVARCLDFFDESSHWQRRLWNVGLALSFHEVVEACQAAREGALRPNSVTWLVEATRGKVVDDPGAGSREQRATLANALRGAPQAGGASHRLIRLAAEDIQRHYLRRWREVLASSESPPGPEWTSRAIASHLLDAGLPGTYLRGWLADLLRRDETLSVVNLLEDAGSLLARPPTRYEVLLLFQIEPVSRAPRPGEWIDSRQAASWLRDHEIEFRPRQRGGLLLQIEAYGPDAAVDQAAEIVERFSARVAVGTRSEAVFYPTAAVASAGIFPLRRSRRVEVRALEREGRVFQLASGELIDAALELLSHLDSGPRAPAVAGGWSGIEILLRGPGDAENVLAGDRLAVLVACSWPRAELTDLGWSVLRQSDDALAEELRTRPTNREKADAVMAAIASGRHLDFASQSDAAAVHRIEALLAAPRRHLLNVCDHVAEALRRLYRQRNLVMHGGRTDAVALDAALRTAAPLVGAGVDRIVHGALTRSLHPLELFARAQFEIERAGAHATPRLTELLE